jgi:hypothetical protein
MTNQMKNRSIQLQALNMNKTKNRTMQNVPSVTITKTSVPSGSSLFNHLPRMAAPHFSQRTSDGPRSQCLQATIVPPEKASETFQSDRPQVLQAPRELKSWKWSHLGHCMAET